VLKDYGNGKMAYKLIDLGYAKEFSDQSGLQSFVGTLHYLVSMQCSLDSSEQFKTFVSTFLPVIQSERFSCETWC